MHFPEQTLKLRTLVPIIGHFSEQMPETRTFVPENRHFSEQMLEIRTFVPEIRLFPEQTETRQSSLAAEQFGNNPPVQAKHPLNLPLRGIIVAAQGFCQFYF